MDVHLVDGTYELFRHFFAVPSAKDGNGQEIGAVRGVLTSVLSMIERGATHIGVATDHVVESFRNDLYRRIQDRRGRAAGVALAISDSRRSAGCHGSHRVADGRIRGRRCTRLRRRKSRTG